MFVGKNFVTWLGIFVGVSFFLSGCAELNSSLSSVNFSGALQKTQEAYEKEGNVWGSKLRAKSPSTNLTDEYKKNVCRYVMQKDVDRVSAEQYFKVNNITNNDLDPELVRSLFSENSIDYFNVHSDLKDSFKKGFRLGYQERIADLVLGPHLTTTAACIGMSTSQDFVEVIEAFEGGWAKTLDKASKTFIVLISEGSQADRVDFMEQFTAIYGAKWAKNDKLKKGGVMRQISAGGTALYIDMSKDAAGAVMDIPHQKDLKEQLYMQTFIVMGDEWGRRYATNLIKRDELVDLLRRVKPVLSEAGNDRENLTRIYDAFNKQYMADKEAFHSMVRDAGIDVALLQPSPASSGVKKK